MKKLTLMSLSAAMTMTTAIASPADKSGHYYNKANDLVGSISARDRADYKTTGIDIKQNGTKNEMGAFFKKTIVAETSTENAINFALKGKHGAMIQERGLTAENKDLRGSGLLQESDRGVITIDKTSQSFKNLDKIRLSKWDKHVGSTQQGRTIPDAGFITPEPTPGTGPIDNNPTPPVTPTPPSIDPIEDMPIVTPKEPVTPVEPSPEEPIVAPIDQDKPGTEPKDPIEQPVYKEPVKPSTKTKLSAVAFNMTAAVWNNADDTIEVYTGVKAVSVRGKVHGIDGSDQYLQFVVGAEYQYEVAQDIDLTIGLEAQLGSDVSGVSPFVGVNYNFTEDLKSLRSYRSAKSGYVWG